MERRRSIHSSCLPHSAPAAALILIIISNSCKFPPAASFAGPYFDDNQQYPNFAKNVYSTSWTNTPKGWSDSAGLWVTMKPILVSLRATDGSAGFLSGFYCQYDTNDYSCLFAILIFQDANSPRLVWSANRNRPVRYGASLTFREDGNLVLADADGTFVWSTNTTGKSAAVALNLTEHGNLVLLHPNNKTVWQSFDYPTDSLLLHQKLLPEKQLISSVSASNWSQGLYSLSFSDCVVSMILQSSPPQLYCYQGDEFSKCNITKGVEYMDGSLTVYDDRTVEGSNVTLFGPIPEASSAQYIQLGSDGHLRVYHWNYSEWKEAVDLTATFLTDCQFPLACGKHSICSAGGQCSCPGTSNANGTIYFEPIDDRQPDHGCSPITPISCHSSQSHSLLELQYVDSFTSEGPTELDLNICKETCLNNCSCKAALFIPSLFNASSGECYLLSEVFSIRSMDTYEGSGPSTLFLKVEDSQPGKNVTQSGNVVEKKVGNARIIIGSSLAALFGLFILIGAFLLFISKQGGDAEEVEEDHLDCMPGMPTRFSYQDLKVATQNFTRKLGEGGFGSVFQGTLTNGTEVAVKHLEGLCHVKKSFLAEVETIGSIHHVNLVRLIGFCAEKTHRLLVYEYMRHGSLDKWIFHGHCSLALRWEHRRKIILDVAKGLSYLHTDCRKKIFHLDIKPQNILLDEDFSAKVSDFGLSKLVDKDQSQVVTTMRGTPGYLAPEWLNFAITEKADVYSFGVVVLEILCGRRNIDRFQSEEAMHLLAIFKRKAEENRLVDMIDKCSTDMQTHADDAVEMMKLGAWCLQSDFSKRPSMSVVVKVLEGSTKVEDNLEYKFSFSALPQNFGGIGNKPKDVAAATVVMPSTLSAPR